MRNYSDRQRRAMFAKMNKAGVSLLPAGVEFKSSYYDGIIPGVREIESPSVPVNEVVPDWVSSPVQQPLQETTKPPDLGALEEYGKRVKEKEDVPVRVVDTSDVIKQADDFIAEYGKNLPKEKKVVGAAKMDDEYALEGPVKLVIRNRVNKDLDNILLSV